MELTPPPLAFFTFVPPLFLQCLLLHPVFPDYVSRPARALLVLPTLKYAFTATLQHGWQPRQNCVLPNFFLGIGAAYAIWATLEWGLVADRTPYVWIGVESDYETTQDSPRARVALRKDHARHEAVQKHVAATSSHLDVLLATLHLFTSMRGTEYAFGPSTKVLRATAGPTAPLLTYFKLRLLDLVWSHAVVLLCGIAMTAPPASRLAFLHSILPNLSLQHLPFVSDLLLQVILGMTIKYGFTIIYSYFLILAFLTSTLPFISPLDPRQYRIVFYRTWTDSFRSVTLFWGQGWHAFLRRSFQVIGGDPTTWVVHQLRGSESMASDFSVLVIFGVSAWLHEKAIYWSTSGIVTLESPRTNFLQWGATIFFLLQGIAILLERAFTRVTGRTVGGPFGRAWSTFWLVGLGAFTVGKTWITLGLFSEIPDVSHWTWPRFVFPLYCFAPSPLATK